MLILNPIVICVYGDYMQESNKGIVIHHIIFSKYHNGLKSQKNNKNHITGNYFHLYKLSLTIYNTCWSVYFKKKKKTEQILDYLLMPLDLAILGWWYATLISLWQNDDMQH